MEEKREGRGAGMEYVYGCCEKGEVYCEGLVEQLADTSDTFYDLALFRRRLSESEEKEYRLIYLGKIEE